MLQDPVAVSVPSVPELLESFEEYQRLVAVVKAMTKEIERLHDDNAQLRAAVNFYREAIRGCKRMARRSARATRIRPLPDAAQHHRVPHS
jgi:hypothetical protein